MLRIFRRIGTAATARARSRPSTGPVLYHLHIPKTAGTTLYAQLGSHFAPERVCPVLMSSLDLLRMPSEQFSRFDLIGGHLEFGYHLPTITGRPVRAVTMLREPRALLLSLYKQVMQEPLDPIRKYVDEHCPTIEEFFFDPKISTHVANTQTLFLGVAERRFDFDIIRRLRATMPGDVLPIIREANSVASAVPAEEALRRARRRLDGCLVVGLVEKFEESYARICAAMRWQLSTTPIARKNVSAVRVGDNLSPRLLARLDELSWMDRVLYEEASARLNDESRTGAVRRAA